MKPSVIAGGVVMLGAIAVVIAFQLGYLSSSNSEPDNRSSAFFAELPPPADVQELVDGVDAVVIGRIGAVLDSGREGPYGQALPTPDASGRPFPGLLPFTYYQVEIDEVLLDDGIVRNEPVLRIIGLSDEDHFKSGEEFLMVLARNPDNESYGVYGDHYLLRVNKDQVLDYSEKRVEFGPADDPAAFIKAVKTAIPGRVPAEERPVLSSPVKVREDN